MNQSNKNYAIKADEYAGVVEKTFFSEVNIGITAAAVKTLEFFTDQGDYLAAAIAGTTRISNIKTGNKITGGDFFLTRLQLFSTLDPNTDVAVDVINDFSQFVRRAYIKIERGSQMVYDQPLSRFLKPSGAGYRTGATDTAAQLVKIDGLTGPEVPLLRPIVFEKDQDFTCKIYGYWPNAYAAAIATLGVNMIGQFKTSQK